MIYIRIDYFFQKITVSYVRYTLRERCIKYLPIRVYQIDLLIDSVTCNCVHLSDFVFFKSPYIVCNMYESSRAFFKYTCICVCLCVVLVLSTFSSLGRRCCRLQRWPSNVIKRRSTERTGGFVSCLYSPGTARTRAQKVHLFIHTHTHAYGNMS